jgi:recombination protein RecA
MDIRRISTIKDSSGAATGSRAKVKVVKNKVAPPFTEAEFDIMYAQGISWEGSILDAAIEHNLIEKRGSWLSMDGKQLGQGRDAAVTLLQESQEMQDELVAKILAKLEEKKSASQKKK